MFYTYAHLKPDNSVFYIGKGQRRRAWDKVSRSKRWKQAVEEAGSYKVQVLAKWETEQDAFEHEIFLIACFKDMGVQLVNLSKGGYGASGYRHREDTLFQFSESRKGHANSFFGRLHSEETRRQISESKKTNPSRPWLGKPRSEETRRKISEALRGRTGTKHTEESRRKLSLAHMGKKQASPSEETRRKLSEAIKRSWIQRKMKKEGN